MEKRNNVYEDENGSLYEKTLPSTPVNKIGGILLVGLGILQFIMIFYMGAIRADNISLFSYISIFITGITLIVMGGQVLSFIEENTRHKLISSNKKKTKYQKSKGVKK